MKTLLISLLLLSLTNIAFAGNSVIINQVTSGNSNNITVDVDGNDNEINMSHGGGNNTINITQEGKDGYVGYTSAWGSGASWGGDLDGNSNSLLVKHYHLLHEAKVNWADFFQLYLFCQEVSLIN